jgi:LAO/AO transport system kinase
MPNKYSCWRPRVRLISALTNDGIDDLWELIQEFKFQMMDSGEYLELRAKQRETQMWTQIENSLIQSFRTNPKVMSYLRQQKRQLRKKEITPGKAAENLLDLISFK